MVSVLETEADLGELSNSLTADQEGNIMEKVEKSVINAQCTEVREESREMGDRLQRL